jgi:hypothetical protein
LADGRAGYSKRSAGVEASRLLSNANLSEEVERQRKAQLDALRERITGKGQEGPQRGGREADECQGGQDEPVRGRGGVHDADRDVDEQSVCWGVTGVSR